MGRIFYVAVRVALALAFLVAGVIKLARPEVFAVTVQAFGILPDALVGPLSVILPAVEVGAALLLLFDRRGGLALTALLLAVFVAILLYALRMGLDIDCGCYGPDDPEGQVYHGLWPTLWRDLAMLVGVAYCAAWKRLRGNGRKTSTPGKEHACAPSN